MSRIRLVSREEATGPLAEEYAAAEKRGLKSRNGIG